MYELNIDTTEVQNLIRSFSNQLSEKQMETVMRRVITRVGGTARKAIWDGIKTKYDVPQKFVYAAIPKTPKYGGSGANVSATFNLKGTRGVNGPVYKIEGMNRQKKLSINKIAELKMGGKLRVKILKARFSTLPSKMDHQGGNPPFYVGKYGIIFTRKRKSQAYPIVRTVGLGVPQLPFNQSQEDIQKRLDDTLMKRTIHELGVMLRSIK